MKVRIGFGLGTAAGMAADPATFAPLVDDLERLGFDSLWLSERLSGPAPDPLAALAFAAGRTSKLKLGTSVLVVPGRNPAVLATELATIDRLSGGRLLPAVGLGAVDPVEQQGFGLDRSERAGWFDEVVPLLRRFWSGEAVDHAGKRFRYDGVRILPTPVQSPLEMWLGGIAPSELRRVGRLGDGWLPSFCPPDDVAASRPVVEAAAAEAGREIEAEHWGPSSSTPVARCPTAWLPWPGADPTSTSPSSSPPASLSSGPPWSASSRWASPSSSSSPSANPSTGRRARSGLTARRGSV